MESINVDITDKILPISVTVGSGVFSDELSQNIPETQNQNFSQPVKVLMMFPFSSSTTFHKCMSVLCVWGVKGVIITVLIVFKRLYGVLRQKNSFRINTF